MVSRVSLSPREATLVFQIMNDLTAGLTCDEIRQQVGRKLLDLLDAQYFASYIWNGSEKIFGRRVLINMSEDNIAAYEHYYQFRDPITPILQKRRQSTCVSEIISRARLERSEFYNDFLVKDGLHYGVNYFAYVGAVSVGDLRIWRGRHKEDFTRRDLAILDAIGSAFTNAMRMAAIRERADDPEVGLMVALGRLNERMGLTDREREICTGLLRGLSDKEIADTHHISTTTVRTHIKHIFQKLGISKRSHLQARCLDWTH